MIGGHPERGEEDVYVRELRERTVLLRRRRTQQLLGGCAAVSGHVAARLLGSQTGDSDLTEHGLEIRLALDALVPKEKILEHYLSAIEWGERVFGVEAAAWKYFGLPASRLDASQSAWLAAMIPNPGWYLAPPAPPPPRAEGGELFGFRTSLFREP